MCVCVIDERGVTGFMLEEDGIQNHSYGWVVVCRRSSLRFVFG
jgi:hypothetical protein